MDLPFTSRAIAYLKASLPSGVPSAIKLSGGDSPIIRSLADGLCICYVVDDGAQYVYVQQRHLDQDGISDEDLHGIGIANLAKLTAQRTIQVQPYGEIFAVLMGGDFEASLILLDDFWDNHFRQFVSGQYAVAVPNRDILAFADASSSSGLATLEALIARIHTSGDHPIADAIYLREEAKWKRKEAQPGAAAQRL